MPAITPIKAAIANITNPIGHNTVHKVAPNDAVAAVNPPVAIAVVVSAAAKPPKPNACKIEADRPANCSMVCFLNRVVTIGNTIPKVVKVANNLSPKDISELFQVSNNPLKELNAIAVVDIIFPKVTSP